jgi:hypothetical protein
MSLVRVIHRLLWNRKVNTYHQVALALLVSHFLLKSAAEGVQRVSSRHSLGIRKETNYIKYVRGLPEDCIVAKYLRHFRPDTSCFFSSSSLKVVLEEIAARRSSSLDEVAPRSCFVTSFHGSDCFQKSASSVRRKPMSTRTLMNSGKPA